MHDTIEPGARPALLTAVHAALHEHGPEALRLRIALLDRIEAERDVRDDGALAAAHAALSAANEQLWQFAADVLLGMEAGLTETERCTS